MDQAQQHFRSRLVKWVIPPAAAILSAGAFISVPLFTAPYFIILMSSILMYIILSVSWTVFCAPSQYFSLGIAAFFGVGIYTYTLLSEALPWAPFPLLLFAAGISSSILAFFVGLTTAFLLNRAFVFVGERATSWHTEALRFAIVNLFGLLLTLGVSLLVLRYLKSAAGDVRTAEAIAHFAGIAATVVGSYIAHKFWTFHG